MAHVTCANLRLRSREEWPSRICLMDASTPCEIHEWRWPFGRALRAARIVARHDGVVSRARAVSSARASATPTSSKSTAACVLNSGTVKPMARCSCARAMVELHQPPHALSHDGRGTYRSITVPSSSLESCRDTAARRRSCGIRPSTDGAKKPPPRSMCSLVRELRAILRP
eukprot:scaffold11902_cov112-Isochrysis_galbana.AAC.4